MPNNQGDGQSSGSSGKEEALDALTAIGDDDLADLPQNVRDAITKAKGDFTTLQTTAKEAEARRIKTEEFARAQQGRADKLDAVVRKHHLPVDGAPEKPAKSSLSDEIYERFVADGLPPEQAKVYTKMFTAAGDIQEQQILAKLGPLAGSVSTMQAEGHLQNGRLQHAKLFAIPEVAKEVQDNVAFMVSQGSVVNQATIDNLVMMSFGKYSANATPDQLKKIQQTDVPNFGNHTMGNGGVPNLPAKTSGAPVARNQETINAMAGISQHLNFGIPKK